MTTLTVKDWILAIAPALIIGLSLFFLLHLGKPETLYQPKSKAEKYKQLNAWTYSITIGVFILLVSLAGLYKKSKR